MAYAASATIRRHRNFAEPLSASLAQSSRIAAKILSGLMFDFLGAISPARAKSSDGIVNDALPEVRCTDCCHCFTQDTIGCFAVHLFLWELLRAKVALLLVNVVVDDARIGNVVIIWREPPPDRSRDGS